MSLWIDLLKVVDTNKSTLVVCMLMGAAALIQKTCIALLIVVSLQILSMEQQNFVARVKMGKRHGDKKC